MSEEIERRTVEGRIAECLMMVRRGNPAMGGPSFADQRDARRLIETLERDGYEIVRRITPPEGTAR